MKGILNGLRTDLVERRLLPIVAVLVAGVIAVPVLAHEKRSAATAQPVTQTTTPAATTPRDEAPAPGKTRGGAASRDPFRAPAASSSAPQAQTRKQSATTPSPQSSSTSSSPPTTTTRSLSPSRSGSSGTLPKRWTLRAVDLRFGTAEQPRLRRDVARLSVFPSAKDPVALLFGATASRNAVVFYLLAKTTVRGTGTCIPRVKLCTQLVLRPGQKVVLTRPNGKRYRLSLARITTTTTTSSRRASRAYARVSKAGQCVLDTFGAFGYDGSRGVVGRRGDGKGCRYGVTKPNVLGLRE